MSNSNKPKRISSDFTNVCVRKSIVNEIKEYFESLNEKYHLGDFFEKGAAERLYRIKKRNTPLDLLSDTVLIKEGWVKIGNATYQRDSDTIMYSGTFWYHNGEQLTAETVMNKVGNKLNAKFNPKFPKSNKESKIK